MNLNSEFEMGMMVASGVPQKISAATFFAAATNIARIPHHKIGTSTRRSAGLQPALDAGKRKAGCNPALRPKLREQCGVAQICNLLYRGFATRWRFNYASPPINHHPQPIENRRYGRLQTRATFRRLRLCGLIGFFFFIIGLTALHAQTNTSANVNTNSATFNLSIGLDGLTQQQGQVDGAIKIVVLMTLLTLAPSIILLMTCFTRIVIVLSFVRSALSVQGTPSNQIIIGLSLFLTFFIMSPVWQRVNSEALQPYREQQISGKEALDRATVPIRSFMLKQTRPKDVELFVALSKIGPTPVDQLPLKIVIPSFIISELRTAFQMGFLIFVPFILIDLIVATVLMSMGMMMMPPMSISLPLKILLFVLIDGWNLIVTSAIKSFGI